LNFSHFFLHYTFLAIDHSLPIYFGCFQERATMNKARLLFFTGVSALFLLPANAQTSPNSPAAASSSSAKPSQSRTTGLNVCPGTFANCTQAACEAVRSPEGKIIRFNCRCAAQKGYSLGPNGPGNRNSCQSIPQDGPSMNQRIPSRYAPISSFVACSNKRPWAQCFGARCVVDHVDPADPGKDTAVCSCPKNHKEPSSPYIFSPKNGDFSRTGCDDEYISSAAIDDLLLSTQYLSTPAGKDLPALPITILVPKPAPTTSH
jgi:hypothetical protein